MQALKLVRFKTVSSAAWHFARYPIVIGLLAVGIVNFVSFLPALQVYPGNSWLRGIAPIIWVSAITALLASWPDSRLDWIWEQLRSKAQKVGLTRSSYASRTTVAFFLFPHCLIYLYLETPNNESARLLCIALTTCFAAGCIFTRTLRSSAFLCCVIAGTFTVSNLLYFIPILAAAIYLAIPRPISLMAPIMPGTPEWRV